MRSFGEVLIVACRAKAATPVITHNAVYMVLSKIRTPSLLAFVLATGPISCSGNRVSGVTESSDQNLFFAKLRDNCVTYSGLRFVG